MFSFGPPAGKEPEKDRERPSGASSASWLDACRAAVAGAWAEGGAAAEAGRALEAAAAGATVAPWVSEARARCASIAAGARQAAASSSAYYAEIEGAALGRARAAVRWCLDEHPLESRAAGAAALVLAFPPTRGLLYRATVGLVRSEEAELNGYRRQFEALAKRGELLSGEKARLLERLARAEAEFVRSRDKLESALGSAKGLEREAASIVTRAAGLLGSVRTLSRSKETMELQGALAKQLAGHGAAAGVRAHHEEIARRIAGMEKYGMYY